MTAIDAAALHAVTSPPMPTAKLNPIRRYLDKRGLTVRAFAAEVNAHHAARGVDLGLSYATVSRWATGDRPVPAVWWLVLDAATGGGIRASALRRWSRRRT